MIKHIKDNVIRGLLAIVPLILTILVLRFFYLLVDRRIANVLEQKFGLAVIPGLGFIILALILFIVGFLTSKFISNNVMELMEKLSHRLSFIGWLYRFSSEFSNKMQEGADEPPFKKAVFVLQRESNQWVVGFCTGEIIHSSTQEHWLKVVIPMAQPVTSFEILAHPSIVKDAGMSVEQALKLVVSAGVVTPKR